MAARPQKSFAERRKLALSDFRDQVIEAQSQLSSLVLVMPDGETTFEIPHPMLISDEAQKRLEVVQTGEDLDKDDEGKFKEPAQINGKRAEPLVIRTARALLGNDHEKFIAAGGNSNDITLAWQWLVREQKEIAEADPK